MLCYNATEHKFIKTDDGLELPFLYNDSTSEGNLFDISRFDNYIFIKLYNSTIKEDSIYELKIKDRIGVVLPLASIINFIKSISGCFLYEWYLFLGTAYYLQNKDRIDGDPVFYSICFAILEKKKLEEESVTDVNIVKWALTSENFYSQAGKVNSLLAPDKNVKNKIKLKLCSSYLSGNSYVSFFYEQYLYEKDVIKRFLFCYQIIELLLDDVLIETLHQHILKCHSGNLSLRSNMESMTESIRFNRILEKTNQNNKNQHFDAACKDFLKKAGKDISQVNQFPDSLYQVRNCIVHRLRYIVNTILEQDLAVIDDYFELLINNILADYNKKNKFNIDDHLWFYKEMKDS